MVYDPIWDRYSRFLKLVKYGHIIYQSIDLDELIQNIYDMSGFK